MQENHSNEQKPFMKPQKYTWYMSVGFLIFVLLVSLGFFLAEYQEQSSIVDARVQISELEKNIASISQERKILIADIINSRSLRPSINLGKLIQGFQNAALRANVELKGFSVKDDTITTTLTATEGDPGVHPDPASTIVKMMREYASGSDLDFSLDPITALSGDPSARTTAVTFHVVPSKK